MTEPISVTGWVLVLLLRGGAEIQVPGYRSSKECEAAMRYVMASEDDTREMWKSYGVRTLGRQLSAAGCVPGPEIAIKFRAKNEEVLPGNIHQPETEVPAQKAE